MWFEVLDGYFGCVLSTAPRQYHFQFEILFLFDVLFHVVRYFIVKDVFLWVNVLMLQSFNKDIICSYHFLIFSWFHGLHQYCIAVYFDKYHDVLVPTFWLLRELSGLVAETCFARVLCTNKYIFNFLSLQHRHHVAYLEWGFGGSDIFPLLIHMALGGFIRLRVVFVDILFGQ